jgi:hypothetical protein
MVHLKLALLDVQGRQELNDLPTSVGGDSRGSTVLFFISWTLTIRQLPLAGFEGGAMGDWCRVDINDPPTSVGGIRGGAMGDWCRLDINDPPTSVGGIRGRSDG